MDLRTYMDVLRRRAFAIILIAALGLGLAIGYSKLQTPIYTATATVLVKPPPGSEGQNLNNIISMDTEAQVAKSADVATAAAKLMNSDLDTQLLKHVSAKTTPGSFVLAISYWDPDPEKAAVGANAFANAYVEYRRMQGQDQIKDQQDAVSEQISSLQKQQAELNRIIDTSDPGTPQYRNARDALDQLGVRLAVLASALASIPQVVDPGQVILPASPPKSPSSPKVLLNATLGLLVGLAAGVVLAFVLERIDDRIHRAGDVELYTEAPVLANVPHVSGKKRERSSQLVVHLESRSPVAEAYRTIRASILSLAHKRGSTVLGITSAVQGEGKSMTSANVAAALGQTDKRVLVVSADIRKPRIHEFFGVTNEVGLSEVLEGASNFGEAVVRSEVDNIWVLAGGQFPEKPAELLQSPAMADLVASLRQQFDFVIVDCPPVLGLADCLAILPLMDAVVLVAQAERTRGAAILEVSDRLDRVGVSIDAVILNDVRISRGRPGHSTYGYYMAPEDYLRPTRGRSSRPPSILPAPTVADDEGVAVEDAEPERSETAEPGGIATPATNGGAAIRARFEPTGVTGEDG